ncbi:MAG: thioredoxin domain-containing protein [Pseudomonadota bacterium]
MKKYWSRLSICFFAALLTLCFSAGAFAKVTWETLKDISLDDTPRDITLSRDGTTAYILCEKSILVFSTQESKVTDTVPIKEDFTQITLSPDESTFFLTNTKSKKISLVQIAQSYEIEAGKSPVIGKEKAPVTVVAFLDYQCPYCARVYPTLKQLLEKYPKDVRLIIKHFPLPMHRFAEKASFAALAAAQQNKYEKLTELLFNNFSKLTDDTIKQYAQEAGLDMKKFDKAINDEALKEIVMQDRQLGQKVKVRGVPAIFINGTAAKARSLEAFSETVEQELKKKH